MNILSVARVVGLCFSVLFITTHVGATYDYYLQEVPVTSASFSPLMQSRFLDCWVVDSSRYAFDCYLPRKMGHGRRLIDGSDVAESLDRCIRRCAPQALWLRGFYSTDFFVDYLKWLLPGLMTMKTIQALVLDGPGCSKQAITDVVMAVCGSGGKRPSWKNITFPASVCLEKSVDVRSRGASSASSASAYSFGLAEDKDDCAAFLLSPYSELEISSRDSVSSSRRSTRSSDILHSYDMVPERPTSVCAEMLQYNRLCAQGGSAFVTLGTAPPAAKSFDAGYKIKELKLTFVFPRAVEVMWQASRTKSISEALLGFMAALGGGAYSTSAWEHIAGCFFHDYRSIPDIFSCFKHRIALTCFFEEEPKPFLEVPLTELKGRIVEKILAFLGNVVPQDLQDNERLWGYCPEGTFEVIATGV